MQRPRSSFPNILWIVLEDVSPEFGCYDGPDAVRTPNIDRLAAEGATFTDAYATNPMCSPSRSALTTGMYQTTLGAHHQRVHQTEDEPTGPNPLPDGVRVVSDRLRDADYRTANLTAFPDSMDLTRSTGASTGTAHTSGSPNRPSRRTWSFRPTCRITRSSARTSRSTTTRSWRPTRRSGR
ncbi:hypothetical protein BRC78_04215 [Halobacteriales archaeon QH_8_68_33]|nr:MAG: hypothetical protein BRC78_04215 [Halobacteriales archaeon QH_8_68_33]